VVPETIPVIEEDGGLLDVAVSREFVER